MISIKQFSLLITSTVIAVLVIVFFLFSGENSSGTQNPAVWENVSEGQEVFISGTVRRIGNEPFTRLVITDSQNKNWNLDSKSQKKLIKYEQKTVKVLANVTIKKVIMANKKEMPSIRELFNLQVLGK